jgi:hypothetical protein
MILDFVAPAHQSKGTTEPAAPLRGPSYDQAKLHRLGLRGPMI